MMKAILLNIIGGWNFIKIIRIMAGTFILISGIYEQNTSFILLGSGFLLVSLITAGSCCAMHNPTVQQKKAIDINDTEYEEVGAK